MDNVKNKVLFDPGFAPIIIDSLGVAGYTYYMFSANNNTKFKRLNFPHTLRKIEASLIDTVSFYLGCMLWASCLKNGENAIIEGNQLLGEENIEKEYTNELDFLIDLVENQLPRDCKYYLNKEYEKNENFLTILKNYREFLVVNKGFTSCDTTDKIVIPDNFKKFKDCKKVSANIKKAIEDKNIREILDMYGELF